MKKYMNGQCIIYIYIFIYKNKYIIILIMKQWAENRIFAVHKFKVDSLFKPEIINVKANKHEFSWTSTLPFPSWELQM